MVAVPARDKSSGSSSSDAVLESASNGLNIPSPLFIAVFILFALYIVARRAFNFIYPCQTTRPLREHNSRIEKLILDNNSVSGRKYILKDTAPGFTRRCKEFDDEIGKIESKSLRDEPSRWKVVPWAIFWWKIVRRVDKVHIGQKRLEGKIEAEIARVTGSKQASTNPGTSAAAASYASGVDV